MDRTERNHEVLKIDISGAPAIGKTTVGILLAQALAEAFKNHDLLIPISVVNAEGDWPARHESMSVEGKIFGGDLRLPKLKRVVITDVNRWGAWQRSTNDSLENIAELPPGHVSSKDVIDGVHSDLGYSDIYVGSALPDLPEPRTENSVVRQEMSTGFLSEAPVVDGATIQREHTGTEPRSKLRTITTHQASPLDKDLKITVLDERGSGNANHEYFVTGMTQLNLVPDSVQSVMSKGPFGYGLRIPFQNGPVQENGVNGLSNEVLLAIVADRLDGFQSGPYACEDNGIAMMKILSAIEDLQRRTKRRLERGVEGTSQV